MDGTFTKEIFRLTVLLEVSVDADNHAVLIGWALVRGGSESSWRWLLSHLYATIPNVNSTLTAITSYRDKGLRTADEIPLANRAFCIEHISRSIQKN